MWNNVPFSKCELRLCHTSRATLTDTFATNYDGYTPVLVASADPFVITAKLDEWFGLTFSTPFEYDRSYNLIVEIRWQNESTGAKVNTWAYETGVARMLKTREYNGATGDLVTTINRYRLTYDNPAVAPTSLGRVRALYR